MRGPKSGANSWSVAGRGRGFTIIELLIVVIVIGILAAAGLAKYQNFAETSRRKTCLGQLLTIETAMGVWEANNTAFAVNFKSYWGFSTRTGRLTQGSSGWAGYLADSTTFGSVADAATTVNSPGGFWNLSGTGPLNSIIRDQKVWVCPSALSRYYGGEIQNVADDYLDTLGGGVSPGHGGTEVGYGGHYMYAMANKGNVGSTICNGGFPAGLLTGVLTATTVNTGGPCPQVPFSIAICGCYGTFGPSSAAATPGTATTNQGGPVGPDGSSLNRHSARW